MALFLSTYINRIDKKGRVSVPSSFRSVLEQNGLKGMICYPSPTLKSIEGCTANRMQKISDAIVLVTHSQNSDHPDRSPCSLF